MHNVKVKILSVQLQIFNKHKFIFKLPNLHNLSELYFTESKQLLTEASELY